MKSVYCEVRTGSLNKAGCASSLKGSILLEQAEQSHASLAVYRRASVTNYSITLIFFVFCAPLAHFPVMSAHLNALDHDSYYL